MKVRPDRVMAPLFAAMFAVLLGGCGSPPANQTNANKSNAVNSNSANTNAQATDSQRLTSSTCTAADDAQINQQIRIFIDEDAVLRPQRLHINFNSKFCNVKLQGWVTTWDVFKHLYDKVSHAEGVHGIEIASDMLLGGPHAATECTGGTQPCGTLCLNIPPDVCNIPGDKDPRPSATPTPTP